MIRKKLMIKRLWNTPEVYYKKGAISCLKSIDYSKFLVLIAEPIKNSEYYSKIEKYTQEKSVRIEIIQFLNQDEILKLRDKYLEDKPEVIVAIGGIKEGNIEPVLESGADAVAVASAVLCAEKPYEAAKSLLEKIRKGYERREKNDHH